MPGAMNSNPVLRFDGMNDFLQAVSSPSLAITGDITIYAVANFDDFAAAAKLFRKRPSINRPPLIITCKIIRSKPAFIVATDGSMRSSRARLRLAGVSTCSLRGQQGTDVSHFLKAHPMELALSPTCSGDTGAPLRVGSRNDLFQFMKGDISEILVFNKALSAGERKIIE